MSEILINGRKWKVEYGCTCEEGNYPCSYCMKLAQEEIDKIDKELKDTDSNDS